jgi:hypothetical protein
MGGAVTLLAIGLGRIRERCPHFDAWVWTLEGMARDG